MRIAIFGQKEHGKTTVAKMLENSWFEEYKEHTPILKFADPLYDIMSLISNRPREWLYDNKNNGINPKCKKTIREGLQQLSDCVKDITYDNILIDMLFHPMPVIALIDDGRFEVEAKRTQELQFFNILIYRPEKVNTDPHFSESWLAGLYKDLSSDTVNELFDCVIVNNSNFKDLLTKVKEKVLPEYESWVHNLNKGY